MRIYCQSKTMQLGNSVYAALEKAVYLWFKQKRMDGQGQFCAKRLFNSVRSCLEKTTCLLLEKGGGGDSVTSTEYVNTMHFKSRRIVIC